MDSSLKDIFFVIYKYALIAIVVGGLLCGIYFLGKRISKKYKVVKWYFWTAFLFAAPIIATPLVFFGSLFMDHVKHDNLVPIAWGLINTYSMWFLLGFIGSMKLYGKTPKYLSILPSILSWTFAVGAIALGFYLVNY